MGYAVSDSGSVLGPWRQSDTPIYSRDGGHGMLFHDFDGRLWMTLHQPNNSPNERPLWLEVVENIDGLVIRDSVNLYPAPDGIAPSDRYAVTINGMASFTYLTTSPAKAYFTAGHMTSWTSFDVNGRCEVRIRRLGRPVSSAVVRPLVTSIQARIEDGDVVLELDRPRKLSVECDGDLTDVLFLFANAPETGVPSPDDPGVVWFGPGVHEIGKFYALKPATTYYLAPGAFLKGSFAGGGDGTRVIGRGILSGADYDWPGDMQEKSTDRIDLVKLTGNNIELSGITLVDSPYYVVIAGGRYNRFNDIKILAWHNNTDGISAGPGARIDDCFLRVADDAFKPFVSDTRISRCVLWVDKAVPFQLTWNARHDSGGSEVRDCDVIHHEPFCKACDEWTGAIFRSWHGGAAHIHDLLFEDIRIEGRSPCLIDLFMARNPWSPQDGEYGRFSRLTFRNITCEQPFRVPSRLLGHDAEHPIADVVIENLTIAGRRVDSPAAMNLQNNEFVTGLRMDGTMIPRVIFAPGETYADANRCFGIASSIARPPGGRLWCGFTSGGEGEGHLNYGIVVTSDDDGASWSAPRIVFDTDGDGPIRTDHITVWTAPTGALWILWSQYPEGLCGSRSSLWCIVSENPDADAPTWSPPRKLTEGQNLLTTPTVLADGTWIFPTGCWNRRGSPSRPLISRDHGQTFELGGELQADRNPDFDEYMIVQRTDRTLVIFNRHPESFLQCESTDGGLSWTRQQPNGIRHTNSRFVFMKLHSGNWLLVKHGSLDTLSEAREEKFPENKGRSHLTAYLSCDEGRTWKGGLLLDERECSYPFGSQADDGTVYISYERSRWNQPEILMARFQEEDILAGRAVSGRVSLRVLVNKALGACTGR